ncbi:MAG: serine/threonine protein kinase [Deltaproteobacteria bacterium]|nr:serine/threonine protein kinase [Deltaproteobacteria bacterium]
MGIPLGRYELLRRIAAGGMGEVFLARQVGMEGFEKLLVVKVLMPHLVEDREFVAMFFDEARIAARLNHPNVCQIFDLGLHEDAYYIAMEYIHGEDVVRLWKASRAKSRPVPLALAVRIAADAAAGLDYAHKAVDSSNRPLGLVHRDVSPQNILVTFDGGVKLIDFGVAKAAGRSSHTATGTLKGKYSYMSPEQAASRPIDHRSDVFALGVVLYEMATSLRLFKRDTEVSTLKAVEVCSVPRPSESNPEIDGELEAIILKALARESADRYPDAAAFRLALEDWLVQKRLPASNAHLAAFMQELYAERLASERAEGQPFTEFEGTPSAIFRRASGPRSEASGARASSAGPRAEGGAKRLLGLAGAVIAALLLGVGLAVALRPSPAPAPPPALAAPAATLTVLTRPEGARVTVDGTGQGPQSSDLVLEKDAPSPVPAAGEMVVIKLLSQPPGATVTLDDKVLGTTPLEHRHSKSEVEATFAFKLAGHRLEKRTVALTADAAIKATLPKLGGVKAPPADDLGIKTGR